MHASYNVLYHVQACNPFFLIHLTIVHRFYGKSHPTPDLSIESLRYLNSHQALADIAHFHSYVVEEYKLTDKNRWIAFGGSYPGALAAWLRIKYPHIVTGAVATSAPVQAELDFSQYMEVVGQSLSQAMQGGVPWTSWCFDIYKLVL